MALDGDCPGCNPATISGRGNRSFSAGAAFLYPPVGLKNTAFGPNDVDSGGNIYAAPYLDYAQRAADDSPWTLGVMLRAQGGMGVEFDGVRTFAGNCDQLDTDLKFARVVPSASYALSDGLRVGASLMIGYSRLEAKLYPNTCSPGPDGQPGTADDFAGMRLKGVGGVGYAGA